MLSCQAKHNKNNREIKGDPKKLAMEKVGGGQYRECFRPWPLSESRFKIQLQMLRQNFQEEAVSAWPTL